MKNYRYHLFTGLKICHHITFIAHMPLIEIQILAVNHDDVFHMNLV